jgi:hypothetical protein
MCRQFVWHNWKVFSTQAPAKTIEVMKEGKKLMTPNPDYTVWRVHDQHVLTYLVTSLSREVLTGVGSNSMTAGMWTAITKLFASQSRSRVLHLHNLLVATRKGDLSIAAYFSSMRGFADEMMAAEKPLDDDDIVSYILNGLDADYNSLIEHANGMADPTSPETLYLHFLNTEARLVSQKAHRDQKDPYQMMANTAAHGGNDNKQHRGGHNNNVTSRVTKSLITFISLLIKH